MIENPHYDDTSADKGPKGDKGDTGDKGPKGDKGDTGSQGLKGDKGDTGSQGLKGDKGDTGAQGLKGDKGDTGSQGPKGDKGLKGDKGDTGSQGLKGDKGDKGDTGAQGLKGDKGDQGPAGTFTTPTADVSFGNHRITNLGDATVGGDALNREYADRRYFKRGANVDMTTAKITNLGDATDAGDAVNKNYADSRYLRLNPNVDMQGRSITNMDAPTNPADAATKAYVDEHNPVSKRTYAMNRSLSKSNTTFAHNFPRGEKYWIWFSLIYNGDRYPRIVFHPYGPGFRQDVIGQVDAADYIIYQYDATNISIRRGDNSSTLKEIGIIYVPNI